MILTPPARRAAALIAVTAVAALLLQGGFTLVDMTANGVSIAGAAWRFVGYFTILTNLLVAVVMGRAAAGRPTAPSLFAATTLYIAVVGIVYHALLAALYHPTGWRRVADQGLHTAVPLLTVAAWLWVFPKRGLTYANPLRWLVYPLGYCAYALARGAADGWYPYPFIDAGAIGLKAALLNAAGLAVAFTGGGAAMVALARRLTAA